MRTRRAKTGIPILSIIGYTNAGKTTLFNLLTMSQFQVEDRLFSTLDTATRRLRFSFPLKTGKKMHEVVITDTVGLIRDLPKDLIGAFRPTFDELQESNLLIHLIDISNPCFQEHIEAVEKILFELKLNHIPVLRVFNKEDKLGRGEGESICRKYDAISITALQPNNLEKFLLAVARKLWGESDSIDSIDNVKLTHSTTPNFSFQDGVECTAHSLP
jgi:GTP-binding protein HflX